MVFADMEIANIVLGMPDRLRLVGFLDVHVERVNVQQDIIRTCVADVGNSLSHRIDKIRFVPVDHLETERYLCGLRLVRDSGKNIRAGPPPLRRRERREFLMRRKDRAA
jgi:hypothetical protein